MPAPALEVRALTKRYGEYVVLNDLSLALSVGSLVGLIGPNGAGKTTLIKLLAGLITPDGGSIHIAGYDLQREEARARGSLAYVPDVPNLYPELTVYEHLELVARAHNTLPTFEADAEEALRRFGMWEVRNNPTYTLSRGMVQKVAICGVFVRQSSVLLMDEPGGSLDVGSLAELYDLLRVYRGAGGMALLSSHQWEAMQELCDELVLMRPGGLMSGDLAHLRESTGVQDDATLREVYLAFMSLTDRELQHYHQSRIRRLQTKHEHGEGGRNGSNGAHSARE